MGYRIERIDLAELSDEELQPILDATNLLNREIRPRSVDLTHDELRRLAGPPSMVKRQLVVLGDAGELTGLGEGRYPADGTSADTLICQIRAVPDHRRRGVGTTILEHLVGMARALGRTRLRGYLHDTVPAGAAFAETTGAVVDVEFHENVVKIDDLDISLLGSWSRIEAPGYSIWLTEGAVPDEYLGDIAHMYRVLERDSPAPGDVEPRDWTAERVSREQEHFLEGTDLLTALVVEDASGRAVGMSQLARRESDPSIWFVPLTVVDPRHRGRSLGKLVKGTTNLAALDRWEGGVYQETGNAFTNEPMLAINHAMGFEHELTASSCSVDLADAQRYLDRCAPVS